MKETELVELKVHPELRPAFARMIPENLVELDKQRMVFRETYTPSASGNEFVLTSNQVISGPKDAPDIRIRVYQPRSREGQLPGVLWIHGGGYILGFPEQDDVLCQRFAMEANCVVVSADYRLAPENPYPAALEDCYAVLTWMFDNAIELGIDNLRLAVAGNSAGGGLTAAVCLLARDRRGPSIRFQMPLYPMIDDRNITPSSHEMTDSRVWNRESNILAWANYLGHSDPDGTAVPAYAAPARAKDLSGLPPTYTCIGTLDPFRDETIDFVSRLSQAGVSVEFHLYPGCFHAFEVTVLEAEISQRAQADYVRALKAALHQ
jgi:acetyl esterase/lipase